MAEVSYDAIAHMYDATRGYPIHVSRQIAEALERAAGLHTQIRFLEVGIGTGRIAIPLAERGHQYTGIDISEQMLGQLEKKLRATGWQQVSMPWGSLPDETATHNLTVQRFIHASKQGAMRLVIADATAIPFQDACFDAVIASHVFHLISEWQQALREIMRVLRPGGVLLRCDDENWNAQWQTGPGEIKREWSKIIQEAGVQISRPGASEQTITTWLQAQGLETEQCKILSWERGMTPRSAFEGIAQRLWSNTRSVPDDLFAVSIERLRQWMNERYGSHIDEELLQEEHLVIRRTQI